MREIRTSTALPPIAADNPGSARRRLERRAALGVSARIVLSLLVLSVGGGCAARQRHHERTLRECSTSGDAGRRIERGNRQGSSHLSNPSGRDLGQVEIREVRDDCLYTVKVQAGIHGWESSGFSWVGEYAASPRGDRVAFTAQDRQGWHVVVDGVIGPAFDGTLEPATFSADGRHVMFVGYVEGGGGRVMVDGQEVARAPFGVDHGAYDFTSEGRYVVAIRTEDGGLQVNVGGVLGPRLDTTMMGPDIRASMTYMDFTASLSGGRYAYVGSRGTRRVLVVDGREEPAPEGLVPIRPAFSPSGARLLYLAVPETNKDPTRRSAVVVIDGERYPMPGLNSAEFTRGELPLMRTATPLDSMTSRNDSHLFGVDRLGQKSPAEVAAEHLIVENRELSASDIDVRTDGIVTYRGEPFAVVRGRRVLDVAR